MPDDARVRYRGIVQLQHRGNSAMLTIRRPFLHALNLQAGDTVVCDVIGKCLVVTPIEDAIRQRKEQMVTALRSDVATPAPVIDETPAIARGAAFALDPGDPT